MQLLYEPLGVLPVYNHGFALNSTRRTGPVNIVL